MLLKSILFKDGVTEGLKVGHGVIALSSKSKEKEWLDRFWAMLKGSELYGFANLEAQLIRAHIEYDIPD